MLGELKAAFCNVECKTPSQISLGSIESVLRWIPSDYGCLFLFIEPIQTNSSTSRGSVLTIVLYLIICSELKPITLMVRPILLAGPSRAKECLLKIIAPIISTSWVYATDLLNILLLLCTPNLLSTIYRSDSAWYLDYPAKIVKLDDFFPVQF